MTTSRRVELRGDQKPRILTRPPFTTEAAGLEAIELADTVGLNLDPWQQLFVRVTLAERADGKYAASEAGELVSRQNGKGAGLEAITLHGMFLVRDPLTLWTAHQFKTSSEAFLRMKGWIDGSDYLRRRVKSINSAHGEEGIELLSRYGGARLRFLARSKSSGRGFSPQRIIWDEAQELAKVAFEAMRPSMRAQWNPQSIYAGTVPGPDINNPEHWTRLRDRGRSGKARRLAWMEWSPAGSDDPDKAPLIDLSDRKAWKAATPGLGYRITEEQLESDLDELDEDSFAREVLSIWPTPKDVVERTIDLDAWGRLAEPKAKKPKAATVVLDVSPDRRFASIGIACDGPNGRTLVMVHRAGGTAWVVPKLQQLLKKRNVLEVALHPGSQAALLVPALTGAGIEFEALTTQQMGAGCAAFQVGVELGELAHVGQPELDEAVENAITRMVGEVELWDRRDFTVDITALVACSAAAYRWALAKDSQPAIPSASYV